MTEIQTDIDRLVADLQKRGFDSYAISVSLNEASHALAFNAPVEAVRRGDESAVKLAAIMGI